MKLLKKFKLPSHALLSIPSVAKLFGFANLAIKLKIPNKVRTVSLISWFQANNNYKELKS